MSAESCRAIGRANCCQQMSCQIGGQSDGQRVQLFSGSLVELKHPRYPEQPYHGRLFQDADRLIFIENDMEIPVKVSVKVSGNCHLEGILRKIYELVRMQHERVHDFPAAEDLTCTCTDRHGNRHYTWKGYHIRVSPPTGKQGEFYKRQAWSKRSLEQKATAVRKMRESVLRRTKNLRESGKARAVSGSFVKEERSAWVVAAEKRKLRLRRQKK